MSQTPGKIYFDDSSKYIFTGNDGAWLIASIVSMAWPAPCKPFLSTCSHQHDPWRFWREISSSPSLSSVWSTPLHLCWPPWTSLGLFPGSHCNLSVDGYALASLLVVGRFPSFRHCIDSFTGCATGFSSLFTFIFLVVKFSIMLKLEIYNLSHYFNSMGCIG